MKLHRVAHPKGEEDPFRVRMYSFIRTGGDAPGYFISGFQPDDLPI